MVDMWGSAYDWVYVVIWVYYILEEINRIHG